MVIEHLVHIANRLLKTASESHFNCKSYIMVLVETLVRNIIAAD
jgi:phosphoribosylaminoimidazole-succinocarboxamide synthase